MSFRSVEICAGAGGQAIGLHQAGFEHVALVELDAVACETLRINGKKWGWDKCVYEADLRDWSPPDDLGPIDLLSGGVPCPPFSIAGKQLGEDDERDLFPALLDLVATIQPRGVQAENVRGLLGKRFNDYRAQIEAQLLELGYQTQWKLLNACDFGVAQLRPRTVMVALTPEDMKHFEWPTGKADSAPTVGEMLLASMSSRGWKGAKAWAEQADGIAPTLVGGSKKHGGPDLGPTRSRRAWSRLGVDGLGIADEVPDAKFTGAPKITFEQAALLQGFPAGWKIQGRKTRAYRQVGNAFPPPVAKAVGKAIKQAFVAAMAPAQKQSTRTRRTAAA